MVPGGAPRGLRLLLGGAAAALGRLRPIPVDNVGPRADGLDGFRRREVDPVLGHVALGGLAPADAGHEEQVVSRRIIGVRGQLPLKASGAGAA
jgi:hypothetical protein